MKRCDLDKALPEGIRSFDEWEAKIPKYQTPLMKRLDSLDLGSRPENWTRAALYEIVLWELNRYPEIDDTLFRDLAGAAKIAPGKHREGMSSFCGCSAAGTSGLPWRPRFCGS